MPEIHVTGGRLYTSDGRHGVLIQSNQLGLLEAANDYGFLTAALIGPQSFDGTTGALTSTSDGRLRVDTSPTSETVNLFAGPSGWEGSSWSSKSPW